MEAGGEATPQRLARCSSAKLHRPVVCRYLVLVRGRCKALDVMQTQVRRHTDPGRCALEPAGGSEVEWRFS